MIWSHTQQCTIKSAKLRLMFGQQFSKIQSEALDHHRRHLLGKWSYHRCYTVHESIQHDPFLIGIHNPIFSDSVFVINAEFIIIVIFSARL